MKAPWLGPGGPILALATVTCTVSQSSFIDRGISVSMTLSVWSYTRPL